MTAIIDDAMIAELEASFIARNDTIIRWSDAISQMQMLPGLRGLWPMSAFDASGNAFDLSGNGRTLTRVGNSGYSYDNYGRVPFFFGDGTGDYLSRGDEVGLQITGAEAYVAGAVQGLTFGGWFWFDNAASANEALITKGGGGVADTPYWLSRNAGGLGVFFMGDGAAGQGSTSTVVIGANSWNFLAARFIPSTSANLYQNGAWYTDTVGIPAALLNTAQAFNIGSYNNTGLLLLDGRASLCFLCATALPDGLISSLYNSQKHFFGV